MQRRLILAAAFLLALTAPARAQHELSLALIGSAWSIETAHQIGHLDIEADASSTSHGVSSFSRAVYRRGWLAAGGELRGARALGHAGFSAPIHVGRVDATLTTGGRGRLAVEVAHRLGPVLLEADAAVVYGGQMDARVGGTWKLLEVSIWRVNRRAWIPRVALAIRW